MLTWNDVKELKVGDIIYSEQIWNNLITFVPALVQETFEDSIVIGYGEEISIQIPKDKFPIDSLYLDTGESKENDGLG